MGCGGKFKTMNALKDYLPRYTVEDYKHWEGDWELIEGIPYAMAPSPFARHQRVLFLIAKQIEEQLESCPEACRVYVELDWVVNKNTVVRPDVSVVCQKVEKHTNVPPEVIFEIVSESTAFKDENLKFQLYEIEKVRYYALVYPELENMRVFKLKDNKYKKVFDNGKGSFTFETKCSFSVKLNDIWKRV